VRGFTLVELLVSIAIFAGASAVMFGTLFVATDVYRRGEAARMAGDESTAVLAALQDDLARAVPIRIREGLPAPEGGWIYAAHRGAAGDCVLAFVIENPDRALVGKLGDDARQIVSWWVESGADANVNQLRRTVFRWTNQGGDRNRARTPWANIGAALSDTVVTTGCLHFGVWLNVPAGTENPAYLRRLGSVGPDWEALEAPGTPGSFSHLPPWGSRAANDTGGRDNAFDTNPVGLINPPNLVAGEPYWSAPDAVRISMVLTGGGRFATRGTLVRDISNADLTARISGIKALPTTSGSLLRIRDEWVRYEDFRNGQITIRSDGRGALRSTPAPHAGRDTVLAGQPFSLVVALPR